MINDATTKLVVNLNERAYPVYIGEDLLNQKFWHSHIKGSQVLIVTNQTIASLFLKTLKDTLQNYQCDVLILPDGEEFKTLSSFEAVIDTLISKQHDRSTTLVALGGGVIGDITGFAAACYLRGVAFIQLPTTLLSQVDSSVGGKTGVNHPLAKNTIGAFHQPCAVVVDTTTLHSLNNRELNSGIAEMVKAALIADPSYFCWLEKNMLNIKNKDLPSLHYGIEQAIAIKIKLVTQDEREANVRMLLNLGHTFGHAIEQTLGYGQWLHGEAVSVGLVLAGDFSHRLGYIDEEVLTRIKNILTMAELPIRLPNTLSTNQLLHAMNFDKKRDVKGMKFVLIKAIGQAVVSTHTDQTLLKVVLAENSQ